MKKLANPALYRYKKIQEAISKRINRTNPYLKFSYSQSGEDLIIKFLFDEMRKKTPSYLDIGAHHPRYINNTAIFYDQGSIGVNIEPDPSLINAFHVDRPNDINLNIGISPNPALMDFYIMSEPTLNTTSIQSVKDSEKIGYSLERQVKIRTKNINYVIKKHIGSAPNLISLDTEGLDFAILKSLDFTKYAPDVFCVETISFSRLGQGVKNQQLISFLIKKGYLLYADTHINS